MKIVDVKAYPTSYRVPKELQVSLGIGVEIDEKFLIAHPVIEGPGYI